LLETLDYRLKTVFQRVLELEKDEINTFMSIKDTKNWKGLNHRILLEEIEKEFNIHFDFNEIDTLVNYKIIRATVASIID